MAGIHARARPLAQILDSIARQLQLPNPGETWTPETLAKSLKAEQGRPLIVLDALDEADNVRETVGLLRDLANTRNSDGTPACRLLIGTRAGEGWPLIEEWVGTLADRQKTDLEAVPLAILKEDLSTYLVSVLGPGRFTQRIAEGMALRLTQEQGTRRGWGEFLVASLFAVSIRRSGLPKSDDAVDDLLANAPRTLPEVLDLDLAVGDDAILPRAILTCLSWSKGSGTPLRLLRLLTREIFAPGVEATDHDFNRALDQVRFYLRTSTDGNGELLRRPFHQGLTDYLRTGSKTTARDILETLLGDLPTAEGRRLWGIAEPYLTRHALDHAMDADETLRILDDADYVFHADPDSFVAALARLEHVGGKEPGRADQRRRAIAAIYLQSLHLHRQLEPNRRRQILQIDRARFGVREVLDGLSPNRATDTVTWDVDWASGSASSTQLRATITAAGEIAVVVCGTLPDWTPIAVTGGADGTVRLWNLANQAPLSDPLPAHPGGVTAVACATLPDRTPIAVTGGADGAVQLWNLEHQIPIGDRLPAHPAGSQRWHARHRRIGQPSPAAPTAPCGCGT
ncbi:hypothetical protein AHiyo8_pI69260 (plasmid) [Arthrobacter sp. Hiyo8]|nr:hypothetical protein AHiyo8_pI69260 [Arthrobacter sp. Hiyo8]